MSAGAARSAAGGAALAWVETAPRLGWMVRSASEVPAGETWLSAPEREVLARLRIDKRRSDFRAGRWTAKQAIRAYLREGGAPWPEVELPAEDAISIVAAPDGAPEVVFGGEAAGVEAPLSVSISHAGGRALAVVGPRGAVFGGDLEGVEPRSPALVEDFFTERERVWVAAQGEAGLSWGASLVWSAKEAALKALRTGLREDTRAVEIRVAGEGGADRGPRWRPIEATVVASGRRFEGFWRLRDGQVLTVLAGVVG